MNFRTDYEFDPRRNEGSVSEVQCFGGQKFVQ